MSDTVHTWLELHELHCDWVEAAANGLDHARAATELWGELSQDDCNSYLDRADALVRFVVPALRKLLPDIAVQSLVNQIKWLTLTNTNGQPYTIDQGEREAPAISLPWNGRPKDLIMMAHEVSHAIQIQLSGGAFVPPLARETCAFLGELALIEFVTSVDPKLGICLSIAWNNDNAVYLGQDGDALRASLQDLDSPYHYRLNYPLARLAACEIFERSATFPPSRLFRAGDDALKVLALQDLLEVPLTRQNALPPMPPPMSDRPAITAYRAFGSMAILDLEEAGTESMRSIGEYYRARRDHMLHRTAFLGLGKLRRPIGYATWNFGDDARRSMDQLCVAQGRQSEFQQLLQQHLGDQWNDQAPSAIHSGVERVPC